MKVSSILSLTASCLSVTHAWVNLPTTTRTTSRSGTNPTRSFDLHMTADEKLAKQVTGEELELMLTEWEQPLVVDAYATW